MRRRDGGSLLLLGIVRVTPVCFLRPRCLQRRTVAIRRPIIDRERSRSPCLDRSANVRKVFLPSPFSDELREFIVPFGGDDVGFESVRVGFGAMCAGGFELADAELGERPVVV